MFFYNLLGNAAAGDSGGDAGRSCETVGGACFVIECYGVRSFLEEVERGREWWRECACRCRPPGQGLRRCDCAGGRESVVAAALSWAATEGWGEVMQRWGLNEYETPAAYRARHETNTAKVLATV